MLQKGSNIAAKAKAHPAAHVAPIQQNKPVTHVAQAQHLVKKPVVAKQVTQVKKESAPKGAVDLAKRTALPQHLPVQPKASLAAHTGKQVVQKVAQNHTAANATKQATAQVAIKAPVTPARERQQALIVKKALKKTTLPSDVPKAAIK